MTNYINSRSRCGVPLRPVEEIPIVAPEQDAGLTAASKAVRRSAGFASEHHLHRALVAIWSFSKLGTSPADHACSSLEASWLGGIARKLKRPWYRFGMCRLQDFHGLLPYRSSAPRQY